VNRDEPGCIRTFEGSVRPSRLCTLCILGCLLLGAADPFVGTWKLRSDKSNFAPGAPIFFFATIVVESAGNGLKSTTSTADGEGVASDFTFNCPLDGTPCKVTSSLPLRGSWSMDTMSLKRVDQHTIMATGSKQGRFVYEDRRVVSADGNTMTVTRQGTTPEGKQYESTIVLTRSR